MPACGGGGSSAIPPQAIANTNAVGQNRSAAPIAASDINDPGPNEAYMTAQASYTCSINYFVATTGSDSSSGTSSSTPWLTLTHAAAQPLSAGSCVNVAPGIYLQTSTYAAINLVHGGRSASSDGYVVWRCTSIPFYFSQGVLKGEDSGCVIRSNANYYTIIYSSVPYIIIDGFEFDGNKGAADRAIALNSGVSPLPHHIWVLNSDFHDLGESAMSLNGDDWLFVIHNVWHDTAYCSPNYIAPCSHTLGDYGSGLSIWEPRNLTGYTPTSADNVFCATVPSSICFHTVVEYNVAYHNYNGQSGDANTDGEGIIFDTWSRNSYTGAGLIMGNVSYDNGGAGIECYDSSRAGQIVIANNSTYNNGWDTHDPHSWRGEITTDSCYNVTYLNNTAYAVQSSGIPHPNAPFVAQSSTAGSATYGSNLGYGGSNNFASTYSYPTAGTNSNDLGMNPGYTSVVSGSKADNFALRPGSPAIGFGQAFSLWNQIGTVDAGACPSTLQNCP
jgi:hypothetical protein